jgi:hypothetical protein
MHPFNEYLEKLKNDVTERPPKTEIEDGFRTAVMLIYTHYKKSRNYENTTSKNTSI